MAGVELAGMEDKRSLRRWQMGTLVLAVVVAVLAGERLLAPRSTPNFKEIGPSSATKKTRTIYENATVKVSFTSDGTLAQEKPPGETFKPMRYQNETIVLRLVPTTSSP